jgi:hypothetical protein
MNKSDFILNDNIELLWELIVDTDIVKMNFNYIEKIKETFNSILPIFYDREKNNSADLMTLNKMFISVIINKIKGEFFKEKEIVTSKDIKNERINKFDTELMKQKSDFDSHNTIKVPPAPKFNDKLDDPLEDMELIIKQTIAKRNFDVEQFNKDISPNLNSDFLKSTETSIKKEKDILNKTNELKYIKIDNKELGNTIINNNLIELPPLRKNSPPDFNKRISWGSTTVTNYNEQFEDIPPIQNNNILLKLKQIKTPEPEMVDKSESITLEHLNNKIYILTNMVQFLTDKLCGP